MGLEILFTPKYIGVLIVLVIFFTILTRAIAPKIFLKLGGSRAILVGYLATILTYGIIAILITGFDFRIAILTFLVMSYICLPWVTLVLVPIMLWVTSKGRNMILGVLMISIIGSFFLIATTYITNYDNARSSPINVWVVRFVTIGTFILIISLSFHFGVQWYKSRRLLREQA